MSGASGPTTWLPSAWRTLIPAARPGATHGRGMRFALVEVHARRWGMAHLMAGRGSPPSVGAGWLFSVWPLERPLGTAAPCGTTASSRLFPDIVFTDTYTYRA